MIVKCIGNDISILNSDSSLDRIRRWTDSEGRYNDLETGAIYSVEALEYLDNGIWFYLHTIPESEHPYPYASEFFVIEDSEFPKNWRVSFNVEDGVPKLKRITFSEWAEDDLFFEKLIDSEADYVAIYMKNRTS